MNKILKNTLILTAITLIAGLGLGLVHEITLNPIAQIRRLQSRQSVILVLMQLLTKSVQLVIQDMSSQQPIRTDMAEIFRLVLVSSLMVL